VPSERFRDVGGGDVYADSMCVVVGGKTNLAVVRKVVTYVVMSMHQELLGDAGNGAAKGIAASTGREDFIFIAILLNSECKGDRGSGCYFVIERVFVVQFPSAKEEADVFEIKRLVLLIAAVFARSKAEVERRKYHVRYSLALNSRTTVIGEDECLYDHRDGHWFNLIWWRVVGCVTPQHPSRERY